MTVSVTELWDTTPVVSPITGGVLDHATIVESLKGPLPQRGGIGVSYNCLDTDVPTALCPPDNTTQKTFNTPGSIDGFDFAVYGGLNCKAIGFDGETGLGEIERVFALKESRGVERALMETRFVRGPDDDPGAGTDYRWDAADDFAGGSGFPAMTALALLEGYAAQQYAGQPTLHVPYTVGSFLLAKNALVDVNGKYFTRSGAKVAVGPGYEYPNNGPDGTPNSVLDGAEWMYATGEVMVARSQIKSFTQMDYNTNDIYALAERRYLVAIDCFAAGILTLLGD